MMSIVIRMALLLSTASALRLPVPQVRTVAAAVSAAPLPALAVHELAPGKGFGDVAMSADGLLSAGLGFVITAAIFGVAFDYALKYGSDDGCIISGATGEEVCGKIIDRGDSGCVLS